MIDVTCAELCSLSYEPECPAGFTDRDDVRIGDVEINGVRFIVVRGTANLLNVLRDIWVRPAFTVNGYSAHKGFVSGFYKVFPDIPKQIDTEKTIVTGHSFGGAVALLLGEFLGCKVVTFGCPRTYFRFWKQPKGIIHTRYVCDDDPVPMMPRLFFEHLHEPVELCDCDDEWIDFEDHGMEIYERRVTRRLKHEDIPLVIPAVA